MAVPERRGDGISKLRVTVAGPRAWPQPQLGPREGSALTLTDYDSRRGRNHSDPVPPTGKAAGHVGEG